MAALRAGYIDVAIRQLCFLLQGYLDDMESEFVTSLVVELERLSLKRNMPHIANQHITLASGIILPPVPMNRFPMIT